MNSIEHLIEKQPDLTTKREAIETALTVLYGCFIAFGCFYIFLGFASYLFPLESPVIGLAVYLLGVFLAFCYNPLGIFDPISLTARVIIIACLVKAVNDGSYSHYMRRI